MSKSNKNIEKKILIIIFYIFFVNNFQSYEINNTKIISNNYYNFQDIIFDYYLSNYIK